MNLFFWVLLFLISNSIHSQIQINHTSQDASCSGKGSITINASGGKTPYVYEIVDNTCGLNNKPLQNSNLFSGLSSCAYTVKVTDADGKTNNKVITVGGNYIGSSADIKVNGCGFEVIPKNGSGTINISTSFNGLPFTTPSQQKIFTGIPPGDYLIKLSDACGSEYITSAFIKIDSFSYFFNRTYLNGRLTDSIEPTNIIGGIGPFQFLIVNGTDTLRGTSQNRFKISDIKKSCNTKVVVKSFCQVYESRLVFTDSEIDCINYSQGEATIKINIGVSPYTTYYYPLNGGSTEAAGLTIKNLQKNSDYYGFGLKDGCGDFVTNSLMYKFIPRLSIQTDPSCNEFNSINLKLNDNTFTLYDSFTVECTTCLPIKTWNITENGQAVKLDNLNNGKKIIKIKNDCGSVWTCESEKTIIVQELCDSIKLTLVNAFLCDNLPNGKTVYGDTISAEMYYLKNSMGVIIDSNNKGIFRLSTNGNYIVEGRAKDCGTITGNYTRNIVINIPNIRVHTYKNNFDCTTKYSLYLDYAYRPYVLKDSSGKLFNGFDVNSVSGVYYVDLLPGKYFVKSLYNCWQDTLILPEIKTKIKLEKITVCPAGGSVQISGAKNLKSWFQYIESFGFDIYTTQKASDWYSINNKSASYAYDTAVHTFKNIQPGSKYTIYLHSFNTVDLVDNCPLDSLVLDVPNYVPPTLTPDFTLKCDQSNTLISQFKINKGTAPFMLQEINCSTLANIGNSTLVSDSIATIANLSVSKHCFKITDACLNNSNTEIDASTFDANIQFTKNCDSTSTFYYSPINGATYKWTNKAGQTLGDKSSLTIKDPVIGDEIKLELKYTGCTINKVFPIQTVLKPKLSVVLDPNKNILLCANDTKTLRPIVTGESGPYTFLWNTGSTSDSLKAISTGKYKVEITSLAGCKVSDSVLITIGAPITIASTIKKVSCFGGMDGSITTTISGGIAPYKYKWSDGSANNSIINKPTGSFTLEVTDTANCVQSTTLQINQSPALNAIISNIPASCRAIADGVINIIATGGTAPYRYKLNTIVDTSVSVIGNLQSGVYAITVTDSLKCTKDNLIILGSKPVPILTRIDTLCAGSSVMVAGKTYSISGVYRDTVKNRVGCDSVIIENLKINAPLAYTLNGINPLCNDEPSGAINISNINSQSPFKISLDNKSVNQLNINNLTHGNYVVKVEDKYGCFLEKGIALSNPIKLTLDIGKDSTIKFGDSILIKSTTNIASNIIKKISWSDLNTTCINCLQRSIRPTNDLDLLVEIETVNGCKIKDIVKIKVSKDFKYFAPTVINLNSTDPRNSRFTLYGRHIANIEFLRLFNRFGTVVFEGKNLPPDDPSQGWDGTFRGSAIQSGVYVFAAYLEYTDGSKAVVKGDVTVLR